MYGSVLLSLSTWLSNRSPELVHLAKLKSHTKYIKISLSLFPQPLLTTILLPIFINLLTLNNLSKWITAVFVFFCDRLISLNIRSSRFISVVAYGKISFLFEAE